MEKQTCSCIDCAVKACVRKDMPYPDFCLTTNLDSDTRNQVVQTYREEENYHVMTAAAQAAYEFMGLRTTRIENIIAFANKLGAKKLGIATCVGLLNESRILASILRSHGFEVYGVSCKAGTISNSEIEIPEEFCRPEASICNPILQAKLLNEAKTDLNITMGLCVGHDCLFNKYSEALVTNCVTKDRALAHNPVGALYTADTLFKQLKK